MSNALVLAGIGFGAVLTLQVVQLRQNRRLLQTMQSMQDQQTALEAAIGKLTDAVTNEIQTLQTVSVDLQNAQKQIAAEGSGVDLSPQINEITDLTQRLSASLPATPATPPAANPVNATPSDSSSTPATDTSGAGSTSPSDSSGSTTPATGGDAGATPTPEPTPVTVDTQALWADGPSTQVPNAGGSAVAGSLSVASPQSSDVSQTVVYTGNVSGPSTLTIPAGSTSATLSVSVNPAADGTAAGTEAGTVQVGSSPPVSITYGG